MADATFRCGMLIFPNLTQLDLTGPYEILSRMPGSEVLLIWKNLDPVRTEHGLTILPSATFATCGPLDLVLVPGGGGINPLLEDAETLAFLRHAAASARYVVSVCTGALVLGAAGLLRGRRATTHWMSRDLLPAFGAIPVNERLVVDGDVFTGGGVTAGIDVALSVAAEIAGRAAAEAIQLAVEYDPQPQFAAGSPETAPPAVREAVLARGAARQKDRAERVARAAAALSAGMTHLDCDVLIIGAGGAGMYAAIAAAREGAGQVLLADKSLVGRGGATVMAQMTVAAALGEECPDDWTLHLADTLAAGRGLCEENLAALLCHEAPARIREMAEWRVGWARRANGHIAQVTAPGHSRPRCCYVDFLNTGPAVAATLRRRIAQVAAIRRVSNLTVTDIVTADGAAMGAVALDGAEGEPVTIAAKAVIIAAGGLTRIFRRNSASANMSGDGYALALAAGADLVDMEFVQFFPIGHLAPRLVGMDPIMWDPFRYKLGGRLLDGSGREFLGDYGSDETSGYTTPRDLATYAIMKEVAAGRGSPHGGVYLSFTHVPRSALEAAFGPVIARLAKNGIDLGRIPVEVAPIAHYHMGGIAVDERMATRVPGLYAAGEAAGGANGANRLSGNAIPEALVFGERAGRSAAAYAATRAPGWKPKPAAVERIRSLCEGRRGDVSAVSLLDELRELMWTEVGPFRTAAGLRRAVARLAEMRAGLSAVAIAPGRAFNPTVADWFELRASLIAAEAVAHAALAREESRGAHQREDFPETAPAWARPQYVRMTREGTLAAGLAR